MTFINRNHRCHAFAPLHWYASAKNKKETHSAHIAHRTPHTARHIHSVAFFFLKITAYKNVNKTEKYDVDLTLCLLEKSWWMFEHMVFKKGASFDADLYELFVGRLLGFVFDFSGFLLMYLFVCVCLCVYRATSY